jgi:DNA primase
MFPIRNIQGNVIAYGGRVISGDGVKYLNSSESIVFQKSDVIYGLYEYRQMKKLNKTHSSLVVVEGYMDVVGLAKSGFYGAVATLGTAFSKNHAKILFRESGDIVLCFDGDSAGKNAAMRTIKIVLPTLDSNKKLKILTLQDNKDPDDYINSFGLESFKNAVDNALPVMEFLTNDMIADKDLNMASSKSDVLESLKTFLHDVDDNIYSESLICTIADKVGIKSEQVKKIINVKSQITQNYRSLNPTNIIQKKFSRNLVLEQKLLSEVFVNIQDFQQLLKNTTYEIFPTSINLEILLKCLKIIKEDPSKDIETVILIQMLTDDYPDYREYFFDMLSYGIQNTQKNDAGSNYVKQIINMLERIERKSINQQLKYLGSIPFRTQVQDMEQKYLVGKLSV